MAQNYDINYDDKRFTEVEADKKAALNEVDVTYGKMISNSDKYYQDQINASKDWADKQAQLQQEKTDFAIEKIEQDKAQAKKDYTKEQSGAYVDWRKQSNEYGTEAEKMASAGLENTGYSESSQVSMYNTYQNRVTAARESYKQIVLSYNNAIKDAQLQNSSVLAEIAYQAQKEQLELSLQGFMYKNQLVVERDNKKTQLNSEYYARYQDVLKQINTENALAEEVRQYNASLAQQQAQLAEQKRQFDAQMAEEKRQFDAKNNNQVFIDKNSSDNPETMQSILDLGYGPISAEKLDRLVASGEVEEYTEGGVKKFRKTNSLVKNNFLPSNPFNAGSLRTGSSGAVHGGSGGKF